MFPQKNLARKGLTTLHHSFDGMVWNVVFYLSVTHGLPLIELESITSMGN